MFLGQKRALFAILLLTSSFGLLQSLGCEKDKAQTVQSLTIQKTHLKPILSLLSNYNQSPAKAWAKQIQKKLEQCDSLSAQASSTQPASDLLQNLKCQTGNTTSQSVAHFQHAGFQWDIATKLSSEKKLVGQLNLFPYEETSQRSLFLPADKNVDFSFLNETKALFVFKGNSADGRGLYGPLLDNSQIQDIFGLGSVVGNLLADSRWAIALYPPPNGLPVPTLVLAAGLSSNTVKNSLITQFEKALTQQYQLESRAIRHKKYVGKCFSHVPIFPGLEPCIVIGPQSAVISWNEDALKTALTEVSTAQKQQSSFIGYWNWSAIEKVNIKLGQLKATKSSGVITIEGNPIQEGFRYDFTWSQERDHE